MLEDYSLNYYRELNSKLPIQLQNYEYYLLPINVEAVFNKELQKFKPEKKPLLYSSKEIPKKNFTRHYIENLYKQLRKTHFREELKAFNSYKLNIAVNLEVSNLLIVDIDNSDVTLVQLNAIYEYLTDERKEFVRSLLDSLKNTFTVKSGNNGFHHYFKFEQLDSRIKKAIKSFSINRLLTPEDLVKINATLPKQFHIQNKITIDILTKTGYCICPPSSFIYTDPKSKSKIQNHYSVYKDIPIAQINENLILRLFDFPNEYEINADFKTIKITNIEPVFTSNYSQYLERYELQDIDTLLNERRLLEDREIRKIKAKYYQNKYSAKYTKKIVKDRIKYLIQKEYFDNNGYAFMLYNILNDYKGMNAYAESKKKDLSYRFLPNTFMSLLSKDYDKADRSGFEFAFIISQISMGLNPHILWEYIKKYFSENAKVKSKSFFFQAYNKAKRENASIKSDNPFIPIAQFLEKARKINYKFYFEKSSHSCASVFLALLIRKLKIANDPKQLWRITHESLNNIALMAKMDSNTVKASLDKLKLEGFITLLEFKTKTRNGKVKTKYFNIIINNEKIYKMQDTEYYLEDALPELVTINGIGRIGSQIYSRLLLEGGKTLKEIYQYFPGIENPYATVKTKVEKLQFLKLLEYYEEEKTYHPSITNLYSKIENARRHELSEKKRKYRIKKFINKSNKYAIQSLEKVPKSEKLQIESMTALKPRKKLFIKSINHNLSKAECLIEKRKWFRKNRLTLSPES
ncbi:bifunctional DNA primase/polymerase [Leptospira sp. WS60.C2]